MVSSHPALSQVDILYEIFDHLSVLSSSLQGLRTGIYPDPCSREATARRNALYSAALTCRAFTGPASEALWAVLHDGFVSLLCPFKGVPLSAGESRGKSSAVEDPCRGDITPREWKRWKRCTQRVRCFFFNSRTDISPFQSSFFVDLLRHQLNVGAPLFTHLQALWISYEGHHRDPDHLVAPLFSPTLSTVWIEATPHLYSALRTLAQSAPHINILRIGSEYKPFDHFSPLVCLSGLRKICLSAISKRLYPLIIPELAALEALEALEISIAQRDSPGGVFDSPQSLVHGEYTKDVFPALRSLSVSGTRAEVTELLGNTRPATLDHVKINVTCTQIASIHPTLLVLATAQNVASIRTLEISLIGHPNLRTEDKPMRCAFADVLAPLLHLHALESLRITIWSRPLSISDSDVADMTCAWPRLQHLAITSSLGWDQTLWPTYVPEVVRPSLCALVDLALRCRLLRYLEVNGTSSLSIEHIKALDARATWDNSTQTCLSRLVLKDGWETLICQLSLDDGVYLDYTLHRLFPSLGDPEDISGHWHAPDRPTLALG
ncbi:hypothetical protein C8Q78DRAFT_334753 [Trametes maxima]|nr:hypothetical protein C8Q78DRAFT_334753 [Trametes maxima]